MQVLKIEKAKEYKQEQVGFARVTLERPSVDNGNGNKFLDECHYVLCNVRCKYSPRIDVPSYTEATRESSCNTFVCVCVCVCVCMHVCTYKITCTITGRNIEFFIPKINDTNMRPISLAANLCILLQKMINN
jgi:hypothetical protein